MISIPRIHWCILPTFIELRYTLKECGESGEDASVNADRILRNWGCNMDRRPQAGSVLITPPISKNEVCIYRCVRARLTAYTLLLGKLKPATILDKTILKLFHPIVITTNISPIFIINSGENLRKVHQCWCFFVIFLEIDDRNKLEIPR